MLNSAKFCSLWHGRFFRNSLIDWDTEENEMALSFRQLRGISAFGRTLVSHFRRTELTISLDLFEVDSIIRWFNCFHNQIDVSSTNSSAFILFRNERKFSGFTLKPFLKTRNCMETKVTQKLTHSNSVNERERFTMSAVSLCAIYRSAQSRWN